MKSRVVKTCHRPRRGGRFGATLAGSMLVLGGVFALPAMAQIQSPQLPQLPPLPLPTVSPITAPVAGTIDGLSKFVQGVPVQLGGGTVTKPPVHDPAPAPAVQPKTSSVDSWSLDRLPALSRSQVRTSVSSTQLAHPGSYASLVAGGLKATAGRAAHLVGPLAAPLAVALFALGLLAIAARAPSRLVKVEEERQSLGERRVYRL